MRTRFITLITQGQNWTSAHPTELDPLQADTEPTAELRSLLSWTAAATRAQQLPAMPCVWFPSIQVAKEAKSEALLHHHLCCFVVHEVHQGGFSPGPWSRLSIECLTCVVARCQKVKQIIPKAEKVKSSLLWAQCHEMILHSVLRLTVSERLMFYFWAPKLGTVSLSICLNEGQAMSSGWGVFATAHVVLQ